MRSICVNIYAYIYIKIYIYKEQLQLYFVFQPAVTLIKNKTKTIPSQKLSIEPHHDSHVMAGRWN